MGLVVLPNGEPATPEAIESFAVEPKLKEGSSVVENFYAIRFESREDAARWIAKCRVRWAWSIGIVDATPDADEPTYRAQARRAAGSVHDSTSEHYKLESGDVKLEPYVQVGQIKDKCYAVVGKL